MYRVINWFRGSVRIRVVSASPEMFLNFCTKKGIEFRNVRRVSATELEMTVHRNGYKLLSRFHGRGFEVRTADAAGLPKTAKSAGKRYGLIGGLAVFFVAVWVSSLFIWEIEIYGNETVTDKEILQTLDELGVGYGTFGASVVSEELANRVLLEINDLSWFAINIDGSRASVLVRERVEIPDVIDMEQPTEVYAAKGGVIEKVSVLNGFAVCAPGDTVAAGDLLVPAVSGSVSSGSRTQHSMAEVWARTWYELTAQSSTDVYAKSYTGEKIAKTALSIGGRRINLYFNSGIVWDSYDKIIKIRTLRLPTGGVLPLTVLRETYTQYIREPYAMPVEAAEECLKQELLLKLREEINDGEIVNAVFETAADNGVVSVTLSAECREQIAALREPAEEQLNLTAETETDDT